MPFLYSEAHFINKRIDNFEDHSVSYKEFMVYKYEYTDGENYWILDSKFYEYTEKFMEDCVNLKPYTKRGFQVVKEPPIPLTDKKWKKVWEGNWDLKDWLRIRMPRKPLQKPHTEADVLAFLQKIEEGLT